MIFATTTICSHSLSLTLLAFIIYIYEAFFWVVLCVLSHSLPLSGLSLSIDVSQTVFFLCVVSFASKIFLSLTSYIIDYIYYTWIMSREAPNVETVRFTVFQ